MQIVSLHEMPKLIFWKKKRKKKNNNKKQKKKKHISKCLLLKFLPSMPSVNLSIIQQWFLYWSVCGRWPNPNVMGRAKRKSAFEHAQNGRIHIMLHMRKVSSGNLLSTETFYSIQWFCLRTVKALIRLRVCTGWSGPSLSAFYRRRVSHGETHL